MDVANAAGVSRSLVSQVESGRVGATSLRTLRAIAAALGASIDLEARWRGGEADRLVNEAHSRLHESVARAFEGQPGWSQAPEVAFAIGAERGVIDILAFHARTRSLLIVELKTELTDLGYLLATTSRRLRLGLQIAAQRGWAATSVSAWVIAAESPHGRRIATRHATMIRSALPADGHAMRAWLHHPSGSIAALSFWSIASRAGTTERFAPLRRVRAPSSRSAARRTPPSAT